MVVYLVFGASWASESCRYCRSDSGQYSGMVGMVYNLHDLDIHIIIYAYVDHMYSIERYRRSTRTCAAAIVSAVISCVVMAVPDIYSNVMHHVDACSLAAIRVAWSMHAKCSSPGVSSCDSHLVFKLSRTRCPKDVTNLPPKALFSFDKFILEAESSPYGVWGSYASALHVLLKERSASGSKATGRRGYAWVISFYCFVAFPLEVVPREEVLVCCPLKAILESGFYSVLCLKKELETVKCWFLSEQEATLCAMAGSFWFGSVPWTCYTMFSHMMATYPTKLSQAIYLVKVDL